MSQESELLKKLRAACETIESDSVRQDVSKMLDDAADNVVHDGDTADDEDVENYIFLVEVGEIRPQASEEAVNWLIEKTEELLPEPQT